MKRVIFLSLNAKLTLITMEVLFLYAYVTHIAVVTMKLVVFLNALINCIALSAEMVVVKDTFETFL